MDALSILARVNSQLSSGQEGGSRRRDSLRPRSIIDVDSADSNELFITIHCGGVPQRYDSTTVIIFHTRRNVVVPSAPENVLLDRIKAWPNSDLNDSLLSIVDGFIERIPRFYETATRITMVTDRKGVTDKHETLGSFTDIVIWRGERVVFNRTAEDCDSFVRHVGALSRRMSQRVLAMNAIVIDSKELLRGYLVPFYSLGNLPQVFLGSGTVHPTFSPSDFSLKLKWSQQLAQVITDVHTSAFTLGNLSPRHVLVTEAADVVVSDLSGVISDYSLGWAAPEVISARSGENSVSKASDVYSLGATLWAIALGSSTAASWSAVPQSSQERWEAGSSVPEWFRQLVERCLSLNPARRPGAAEVLDALLHEGKGLV